MAHITGGGLLENLPRMFRGENLAALIDSDAWQRPEIFSWLQQAGNVAEEEMLRTFNCGIGFVLAVPEGAVSDCLESLRGNGETAAVIGRVVDADTQPRAGELLIR